MSRYTRKESEPEPEPEPVNWSSHLIIAAKGGKVVIPEVWDEWGMLVQEEEELTGLELAKRCRMEGADLAFTGTEPAPDERFDAAGSEPARTALDWASAFKNLPVLRFLQLEDATERLIDACRTSCTANGPSEASVLAWAQHARRDGADLLAEGEYIKGDQAWCPAAELCVSFGQTVRPLTCSLSQRVACLRQASCAVRDAGTITMSLHTSSSSSGTHRWN